MLTNSLTNGALYFLRNRETAKGDAEGMLRVLKDYWSAVACVWKDAWGRPARESRISGGPGIVGLGFMMDAVIDRHRGSGGLPNRTQFHADLEPLKPVCHWTSGLWN